MPRLLLGMSLLYAVLHRVGQRLVQWEYIQQPNPLPSSQRLVKPKIWEMESKCVIMIYYFFGQFTYLKRLGYSGYTIVSYEDVTKNTGTMEDYPSQLVEHLRSMAISGKKTLAKYSYPITVIV